ncbi:MAG TPA: hypothetical protein VE870_15705 [Bacteroidales bacterium]|nr:hypothetical protein [Bacteroidales bacterium]
MEKKRCNNYYVHMVHFISEAEQENKMESRPITGNIELIIVLVHFVKKNRPLYHGQQETKVNE